MNEDTKQPGGAPEMVMDDEPAPQEQLPVGSLIKGIRVRDASEYGQKKDNTRLHDAKNLSVINDSVEDVGFMRSIAVDEDDEALAGNGTLQVAQKRGAKVIEIDVDDPNVVVAVRRTGLTPLQKHRYNLADNRATDLSRNNKKAINRIAQEVPPQLLLGGLFSDKEQKNLLSAQANELALGEGGATEPGGTTPAAAPDAPSVSVSMQVSAQSSVRMVQLFLDVKSQPEFVRKARALARVPELAGEGGAPLTTMTDIVVAIVNRAHELWLTEEELGSGDPILAPMDAHALEMLNVVRDDAGLAPMTPRDAVALGAEPKE